MKSSKTEFPTNENHQTEFSIFDIRHKHTYAQRNVINISLRKITINKERYRWFDAKRISKNLWSEGHRREII